MGATQSELTKEEFVKQWKPTTKYSNIQVWQNRDNPAYLLQEYDIPIEQSNPHRQNLMDLRRKHPYIINGYEFKDDEKFNCSRGNHTYKIFIEKIPLRFSNLQDIPFPDILHVYDACLNGYNQLSDVVGYFHVDQDMIGVNQHKRVKVWLNTVFEIHYLSNFGMKDQEEVTEEQMIKEILEIIENSTDMSSYYPRPSLPEVYRSFPDSYLSFAQARLVFRDYVRKICDGNIPRCLPCVDEVGGTQSITGWCRNSQSYGYEKDSRRMSELVYRSEKRKNRNVRQSFLKKTFDPNQLNSSLPQLSNIKRSSSIQQGPVHVIQQESVHETTVIKNVRPERQNQKIYKSVIFQQKPEPLLLKTESVIKKQPENHRQSILTSSINPEATKQTKVIPPQIAPVIVNPPQKQQMINVKSQQPLLNSPPSGVLLPQKTMPGVLNQQRSGSSFITAERANQPQQKTFLQVNQNIHQNQNVLFSKPQVNHPVVRTQVPVEVQKKQILPQKRQIAIQRQQPPRQAQRQQIPIQNVRHQEQIQMNRQIPVQSQTKPQIKTTVQQIPAQRQVPVQVQQIPVQVQQQIPVQVQQQIPVQVQQQIPVQVQQQIPVQVQQQIPVQVQHQPIPVQGQRNQAPMIQNVFQNTVQQPRQIQSQKRMQNTQAPTQKIFPTQIPQQKYQQNQTSKQNKKLNQTQLMENYYEDRIRIQNIPKRIDSIQVTSNIPQQNLRYKYDESFPIDYNPKLAYEANVVQETIVTNSRGDRGIEYYEETKITSTDNYGSGYGQTYVQEYNYGYQQNPKGDGYGYGSGQGYSYGYDNNVKDYEIQQNKYATIDKNQGKTDHKLLEQLGIFLAK